MRRARLLLPVLILAAATGGAAWAGSGALPTGGQFAAGAGAIAATNNGLAISQSSAHGIINWQGFSIGAGNVVQFNNGAGATLNRVLGSDLSRIGGLLRATGSVYLINPNGVLVLPGGQVVTGGSFIASSRDIADAEFIAGGALRFLGSSAGTVMNQGSIVAANGDVVLVGRSVRNDGSILAPNGTVGLAAGDDVLLRPADGDQRIFIALGSGDATNTGTIAAAQAELKAAGGNVYALAGNTGGIVHATGTALRDGHVWLTAGNDVTLGGTVKAENADGSGGAIEATGGATGGTIAVTGSADASGGGANAPGGFVAMTAATVDVAGTASIAANGGGKGGAILLGGDRYGGQDPAIALAAHAVANALRTDIAAGASISADASGDGNGGSVVVWSDRATNFAGSITARGGANGGNGGFVEVSSHRDLGFAGTVDTAAPHGKAGTLLLDPANITISALGAAVANTNETVAGSNPLTYAPNADSAVVNTTGAIGVLGLQAELANGNVMVTTSCAAANSCSGMQSGTITINTPISWSSANSLTLSAASDIIFGGTADKITSSGGGAVTLNAQGVITVGATVTSSGGGGNIALVGRSIAVNQAITSAGNLSLCATGGNITQSAALTAAGTSSFSATNGTITLATTTNALTGALSIATNGTNAASVTNNKATVLASVNVGGNLTVTDRTGSLTQTAPMTVGGTSSFSTTASNATITLSDPNNLLTGAVSLATIGANGNAVLTNDLATALGTSNVGGSLTVTDSVGNLTQAGALTVVGTSSFATSAANATIALTNTANAFTGAVSLNTNGGNASLANNKATVLGASTVGGNFTVTEMVGSMTQNGALLIGGAASFTDSASNGKITLTNTGNMLAGPVTLGTTGGTADASLTNDAAGGTTLAASNVGGNLTVANSLGNLTQSGALSVGKTSTFTDTAAGATIALANSGNALTGTVSLNTNGAGADATLVNNVATALAASTIGGVLSVTDSVGNLTQSGALTVGGASSFATSASGAKITLTNASNALMGAVALATVGGDASLTNNVATALAASTVGGILTVIDKVGDLTQTGALQVGGTSSFTTSTAGVAISLANGGNAFTGAVALNTTGAGGNANLTNDAAGGTALAATSVGGNLTVVNTLGNLTQTGALTVAGTSSFSAANGTITLTTTTNALTGALSIATTGANAASVTDNRATALASVNVGGNLTVTDRTGNLTQTGPMSVGGNSSFSTTASNATITLTDPGNLLAGAVSFGTAGANSFAMLVNALPTTLGTSVLAGSLAVTDSVGNLTQAGALTVPGISSFTISAPGATIALTNPANLLTGAVSLNTNGGDASLANNKATVLGASTVGGNLTVNETAGSMTQAGSLLVGGASSFTDTVSNGKITLTDAGNMLSGPVTLSSTGGTADASLANDAPGGTALAASVGGNLTVLNTLGNLTQAGALSVGKISTFTDAAPGATIVLANPGNALIGAVALNTNGAGADASLTNGVATAFATSTVGGSLTATEIGSGSITVNSGAIVTASAGDILFAANAVTLTGSLTASSGTVTIMPATPGTTMGLGTGAGTLGLTQAEISKITANTLVVGSLTGTGALTVGGTLTLPHIGNLELLTAANLTINAAASITGAAGGNLTLATGASFLNNGGSAALAVSGGGRWLVYSQDPRTDTTGGLAFAFRQYATAFPTAPTPAAGNGFLYTLAPTVSVGLTGSTAKTYDGMTNAALAPTNYAASASITGLGDSISLVGLPTVGAYANPNAGANLSVSASGLTNGMIVATNGAAAVYGYTFSSSSASGNIGTINPATLTVTPKTVTTSYSGIALNNPSYSDDLANYAIGGFVNSETSASAELAFTGSMAFNGSTATAVKNAGTYTQSVGTLALASANGNYTMSFANPVPHTYVINPLVLTLTGSRAYDATPVALGPILSASNLAGADAVTVSGAATLASGNAGLEPIASLAGLSLGGPSAGNYTLAGASGTVTIVPAALTLTAVANTKTYDGSPFAVAVPTVSVLKGSDTVSGLAEAYAGPNAGTGLTLNVSGFTVNDGNGSNNYAVTTVASTAGAINPLAVILSGSRGYDASPAAAAGILSVANLIGGDALSLSGAATLAGKNVGTQAIASAAGLSLGGPSAGNYTLAGVGGAVTIVPTALTIAAAANAKTYDGTNAAAATPTTSGLKGTDTVSGLGEAYASKDAGGAVALAVNPGFVVNDGNGGGNYVLTVAGATGVIDPLAITVAGSRTYDATPTAAAGILSIANLVGGDGLTLAGAASLASGNAGVQPVASFAGLSLGGGSAANYTLVGATGAVTISPAALTIAAAANAKTYDGTTAAAALPGVSGLQGADTVSGLGEVYAAKNVGNGILLTVNPGFTVNDGNGGKNYTVATSGSANGVINPASLTITADDASKPAGQILVFAGTEFSAQGLMPGDAVGGVTLTSAGADAAASVAGSPYPIVPSAAVGTGLGNYGIAYQNGSLTVTPVTVVATPTATLDRGAAFETIGYQGLPVLAALPNGTTPTSLAVNPALLANPAALNAIAPAAGGDATGGEIPCDPSQQCPDNP